MTAEIISVGTELLLGNILNTNAQYLSRELAALGITVQRESTIGDNHSRLADFVNEAKQRCDLLVFTGGLGPTADDTLRLHIRAESDSIASQSAKLHVRDAVLAYLDTACPAQSKPEAIAWAAQHLFELQLTARHALAQLNIRTPVRVQLVNMYFATRRYGSGTLPAGRYDALRIDLGAGKGRNWWCVLYPGLCRSACGSYAQPAENDLVCGEYILRLRLVEWVQQRTARREDVVLVG